MNKKELAKPEYVHEQNEFQPEMDKIKCRELITIIYQETINSMLRAQKSQITGGTNI